MTGAANAVGARPGGAQERRTRRGLASIFETGPADDGTAGRLRDVAEDAGVPVVEVAEFPPEDGAFVEWQVTQLAALSEALAEDG